MDPNKNLDLTLKIATDAVRLNYLFLAPLVALNIPSQALLGLNVIVMLAISSTGLAGNLLDKRRLSTSASISLLCLLVWGRVAEDLLRLSPPETAIFLVEFVVVIFFMETNLVVQAFESSREKLILKVDPLSKTLEARLATWLRKELSHQTEIAVGSIGLSLGLLILAGFTGVSAQQLPLTGALLLLAVIMLVFLVTYQREPEKTANLT